MAHRSSIRQDRPAAGNTPRPAAADRLFELGEGAGVPVDTGAVDAGSTEAVGLGRGLLRVLAYSGATLGDALRDLSARFELLLCGARLELVDGHGEADAYVEIRYHRPPDAAAGAAPEEVFAALLAFARRATGRPVVPVRVGLTRSHRLHDHSRIVGSSDVGFCEPSDSLWLYRRDLELALGHAAPHLAQILRSCIDRLRSDVAPPREATSPRPDPHGPPHPASAVAPSSPRGVAAEAEA